MLVYSNQGLTLKAGVTPTLLRQCHTEERAIAGWYVDVKLRSSPQPKLISSTQKLKMSLKTKHCADADLKMTFSLVHKLFRRGSTDKELTPMLLSIQSNKDSSKLYFHLKFLDKAVKTDVDNVKG